MKLTRRFRSSPLALLIWAALLLSGQTLALAHQHVDEAPGTSCAVCTLAKAETAASDSAPRQPPEPAARWLAPPAATPACLSTAFASFQPRGPPRA